MITQDTKAVALAKLKCEVPIEDIARELNIPIPLILEWEGNMTQDDLVQLKANIHAVNSFAHKQEIIGNNEAQEELLRTRINSVAIEIVNEISDAAATGDVVKAKALQLCADSLTTIFDSLLKKDVVIDDISHPSDNTLSLFTSIMKD